MSIEWEEMTYIINADIKWLQKALKKKDVRQFSQVILVENGNAYATNGHVLHKMKTDSAPGQYSYTGVRLSKEEEIKHQPASRLEALFADIEEPVQITINGLNLKALNVTERYGVSSAYFYNAIGKSKQAEFLWNSDKYKLLVKMEDRDAVIMCCRLPEREVANV